MECSFKMKVRAPKERVWAYYENIRNWSIWEQDLENISLEGPFETGTTGTMKLAGMPPLKFTLTKVIQNKVFSDKTSTPMGDLYFAHELLEESGGLYIRHSVRLDALQENEETLHILKEIFSDVPDSIMLLKQAVEK